MMNSLDIAISMILITLPDKKMLVLPVFVTLLCLVYISCSSLLSKACFQYLVQVSPRNVD